MVGLGAANLCAGFFQGFPVSASASRTPVAETAGARTQLAGVVGAVAVALLLLVAPNLLRNLPTTTLAAVVIASAISLIEVADLRRIYRIQRWEFWLSIAMLRGSGRARSDSGHRSGDRDRGNRIPMGWLAPPFRNIGSRRGGQGLPRHRAPSSCPPRSRIGPAALGCPAVLRQRRIVPRTARSTQLQASPNASTLACRRGRAGHQRRCDRGRRSLPNWTKPCTPPTSTLCFAEMKDPVKDKLKRFGTVRPLRRADVSSRPWVRL